MKRFFYLILTAALLMMSLPGISGCSSPQTTPAPVYPYYPGGMGPGGMMGSGGMMGPGSMGPGGPYRSGGQRISMEQAKKIVEDYLRNRGESDLEATEIMEFEYNFLRYFCRKEHRHSCL